MIKVEILQAVDNQLGEGPVWDEVAEALYWVDIHGRAIHCYRPESGGHKQWSVPVRPSALALFPGGRRLLVAGGYGLGIFDLESGSWAAWRELEDPRLLPRNRTNDGRCDPSGCFWIGTMHDDVAGPTGSLYRVTADGDVSRVLEGLGIPNTLAWYGGDFYLGDSLQRTVSRYSWGPETGFLGSPEAFFSLPPGAAVPDGSAVDAAGNLWTCIWDGARLECRNPQGLLLEVVEMPVQRPTSCAFGGPGLERLYVTSSGQGLPAPNGSLLQVTGHGAVGIAEPRFGTA